MNAPIASDLSLPLSELPVVTSTSTDVSALLANLLSAYGKVPPKGNKRKANRRTLPRNAAPLTFANGFAELKTGYKTWVAQSKAVHLEEQECACCGSRVTAVKGEFFVLSNKISHSVWIRPEGYEIEAPEDLPVSFHHLPPRLVTACGACASSDLDLAINSLFGRSQVQLSFPF